MKLLFLAPLFFIGAFASTQIFASDACQGTSWSQLLDKALESSPEWVPWEKKRALNRVKADGASLGPAGRLAAQYVSGRSANTGEGELGYEWTFEKESKKVSRFQAAQSEASFTSIAIQERKAEVTLEIALIAERIHQIHHEKEVLNETLSTYRSILKQYANIPALSPEQDVTISIFKLARDETQLKLGKLGVELENHRSHLSQITGCSQVTFPAEVRKERRSWPQVSSLDSLGKSATVQRIEAGRQVARDTMEMEIRLSAGDYSIGPMARWTRQDGDQEFGFGLALSVPLTDRRTSAANAQAQASYQVAEAEAEWELKKTHAELSKWINQYQRSLEVLKEGYAEADVHGKHQKMEKTFLAGRVNASLVIEAHRQMLEHMISRHEVEAKASEALWNIRLLTGTLSKDDL